MKWGGAASSGPPIPRSSASLAQRTASITTPAEFGDVPLNLELKLEVERHVAEGPALDPDVAPLAVVQPWNVVARPDVHVVLAEVVLQLRGDRLCLGDLLGLQPVAFQHVLEVHVPAEVELVGAVDGDAAVLHEAGKHTVDDRGADLGLDVVTDDRYAGLGEALRPLRSAGDEHRQAVDERHLGPEGLGGVEASRLLGAHRQVGDEHVGVGGLEHGGDVDRGALGLPDRLDVVAAEPVARRATLDLHPEGWHVGESDGVVLAGGDRLREVAPDLLGVDVEGGDELEVTDVVAPELDVHETGDVVAGLSVPVIVDALHQGRRAVAHADDRDAYLCHFLIATPLGLGAAYPACAGRRGSRGVVGFWVPRPVVSGPLSAWKCAVGRDLAGARGSSRAEPRSAAMRRSSQAISRSCSSSPWSISSRV